MAGTWADLVVAILLYGAILAVVAAFIRERERSGRPRRWSVWVFLVAQLVVPSVLTGFGVANNLEAGDTMSLANVIGILSAYIFLWPFALIIAILMSSELFGD